MQDNDPHHLHPSEWELFIFLIVAPILVFLVVYGGVKFMSYWDKRKSRRDDANENEDLCR